MDNDNSSNSTLTKVMKVINDSAQLGSSMHLGVVHVVRNQYFGIFYPPSPLP